MWKPKPGCLGLRLRSRGGLSVHKPPSIRELSFNCPHCGALAKQYWRSVYLKQLSDDKHPEWFSEEEVQRIAEDDVKDKGARQEFLEFAERVNTRIPFENPSTENPYVRRLFNLNAAQCYNCKEVSLWMGEGMIWPVRGSVSKPNADMPVAARVDYEEASQIVDQSPRGAAALLRLALTHICIALGCEGKNLNSDIKALVERGLDPRVQQALDVVRVVGNNAVHPGELDLKDDRETADRLFDLVNLIVDVMISRPAQIDQMYATLPARAIEAIKRRDR